MSSNLLQPGSYLAHDRETNPEVDKPRTCDDCNEKCESTNKSLDAAGDLTSECCCLCVKRGCPWEIDWDMCELCEKREKENK